jgi:hypothetical protein
MKWGKPGFKVVVFFKCDLRTATARHPSAAQHAVEEEERAADAADAVVGLCKLNQVDP